MSESRYQPLDLTFRNNQMTPIQQAGYDSAWMGDMGVNPIAPPATGGFSLDFGLPNPNTPAQPGMFSGQGMFGQNGWVMPALNTFGGLASVYLGMKQYGLAKDQFKESKRQFNVNFEAQRKLTNSRLEDRQRARVASNPGAYQSVGSYMSKNKI